MGYIIEISESKAEELKEHAEKVLKHGGKLMQCLEELCEESQPGERGGGYYGNRYGNRGGGGSMGYRNDEDWEGEQNMGFRRGVPGSGRGRYRY